MKYARVDDVKAGDTLVADDGFTCIPAGEVVIQGDESGLYVRCGEGQHYLAGQEERGEYIGLSRKDAAQ